jgi:hypothetical protein
MMAGSTCPDGSVLEQLVLGRLTGPDTAELESHLATCSRCVAVLQSLPGEDDLVRALRPPLRPEDMPRRQLAEAVIPALKRLRPKDATVTGDVHAPGPPTPADRAREDTAEEQVPFLAPAQAPKEEGGRMKDESDSSFILPPSSFTRIKILDFGLVQALSGDGAGGSGSGRILGTPTYMAPEQAGGKPVDARADLFSLGCVLYRMATGHPPFAGGDLLGVLVSVAVDEPPSPRRLNPDVPIALELLLARLLRKKPEERPDSAQAVVEALRAIEESRRPKLSRRRWLLGTAAAVLVAVGLAAWGLSHWLPAFRPPAVPGVITFDYDEPDGRLALQLGDEAERILDVKREKAISQAPASYPAEQFRQRLYRPDVIQLLLEKGSVAEAVKAANAARQAQKIPIPTGETSVEKLLPPTVTLAVDDRKKPTVTVGVTAKQGCPEQPIRSLWLLVGGRPLPNRQAAVSLDADNGKPEYKDTWTVELPPGKHTLSVLARSKDGTPGISNEIEVVCPLPPSQRPVVHHVAVGINQYAHTKVPQLTYARADAVELAKAFEASCKASPLYMRARVRSLVDQGAIRAALLKALRDVREEVKANDLFVFSFAGHGVREEGEFFLLTHEADPTSAATLARTAVAGRALREQLADSPARCWSCWTPAMRGRSAPSGAAPTRRRGPCRMWTCAWRSCVRLTGMRRPWARRDTGCSRGRWYGR